VPLVKKTHCKYGHEIAVVGRDKWGVCNACQIDYRVSSERKALQAAHYASPRGKATKAAYQTSPRYKEYRASPKCKAYYVSPERKAYEAARHASPEHRVLRSTYRKTKYGNDLQYKLTNLLRTRFYIALKNKSKTGSAVRNLGCSISELIEYFKSLFQPDMTWENHGKWHIDHVIPLTAFDLADPEQVKKACHFTNLQPLWATDNIRKGGIKCLKSK